MKKEQWYLAAGTVAFSWASWTSATLLKLSSDVAVLKYSVFKIAQKDAPEPSLGAPQLADPVFPFSLLKKEIIK